MHPTGFEPVTFQRKTDYESGAFNHSATNASSFLVLEYGADGTRTHVHLISINVQILLKLLNL